MDWEGEYQKLNYFFQHIGISHHVSCPHAYQQNGSAECKHRHIVEVGLSLLAQASIPLKFWDEAFITATYLINQLPSKIIQHQNPFESLFHQTPNYVILRIFGCACWPNLRPYNTRKLQFHSKQCVFLGYSTMHKGFKYLNAATGRVYISRDVVFDETIYPFSKLHPNAGACLPSKILLLPNTLRNLPDGDDNTYVPSANSLNPITESMDAAADHILLDTGENLEEIQHHFMLPGGVLGAPSRGTLPSASLAYKYKSLKLIFYFSQERYATEILQRTNMMSSKPMNTLLSPTEKLSRSEGEALGTEDSTRYRSIVGALQYLTLTHPDISFSVNKLC